MKKSKTFLIIGTLMFLFAIVYVWIAINSPCSSFSIPTIVVRMIYLIYALINITMFVLFGVFSIKEKRKQNKNFIGTIIVLVVFALLACPLYKFAAVDPFMMSIHMMMSR